MLQMSFAADMSRWILLKLHRQVSILLSIGRNIWICTRKIVHIFPLLCEMDLGYSRVTITCRPRYPTKEHTRLAGLTMTIGLVSSTAVHRNGDQEVGSVHV